MSLGLFIELDLFERFQNQPTLIPTSYIQPSKVLPTSKLGTIIFWWTDINLSTAATHRSPLTITSPSTITTYQPSNAAGHVSLTIDDGLCRSGKDRSMIPEVRNLLKEHISKWEQTLVFLGYSHIYYPAIADFLVACLYVKGAPSFGHVLPVLRLRWRPVVFFPEDSRSWIFGWQTLLGGSSHDIING